MNAKSVPHITLEQARDLVSLLEQGDQQGANAMLLSLVNNEQTELFSSVGKLTRQLHDSLKNFQLDIRLADLALEEIPDAKNRLNYVIDMTENAANKTMDAVEASLPIADKLNHDVDNILPTWTRLMSRDIKVGEFKALCHDLDAFMKQTQDNTQQLQSLLTQVLMAQDYQDLTGQIIRRVIELVREVEDSLINLLTVFGAPEGQGSEESVSKTKSVESDIAPEGPIINAEARDDVVHGQDDVDDLLASLGF